MRHLKRTAKLGRTPEHRNAMLANLVCSLIKHKRVTTTLARAKAARPVAERILTLGKRGTISARRVAAARLHTRGTTVQLTKDERRKWRDQEDVVRILFEEIAPAFKERNGGYTRLAGPTGGAIVPIASIHRKTFARLRRMVNADTLPLCRKSTCLDTA